MIGSATPSADPISIAVIGAGFSGTMAALQILDRSRGISVVLIEKDATFGRGMAYGTPAPEHLLNVRATNMSAYPNRPDHFVQWLASLEDIDAPQVQQTPAGTFVSRKLYGRYIASL